MVHTGNKEGEKIMAKAKENQEINQQANNQRVNRQQNEHAQSAESSSQAMQTTGRPSNQQTGVARREQYAPSVWSGSPFAFMRRFMEEMDRLFEDFGAGHGLFGSSTGRELAPRGFSAMSQALWSPQTEVFERGGQLVVRADLPGLTKDDIEVNITDEAITIEVQILPASRTHTYVSAEQSRQHANDRPRYERGRRHSTKPTTSAAAIASCMGRRAGGSEAASVGGMRSVWIGDR